MDFWFEFGSTYSYPAAMRIETLAVEVGVAVSWRAFLLGPIFHCGNDRLEDALSWAVDDRKDATP